MNSGLYAPEGFAANLAEMAHFTMKLRLSSLLGDTLVLEEIVIRGPVEEVEPLYARTDVLVLPTRRDSYPRVIMEAMCRGIPVVASRVDGIPEMVEDGVTGLLCEPGDPASLASRLDQLYDDPALAAALGKKARERAETLYAPETYYQRLMAVFAQAMGGKETKQ